MKMTAIDKLLARSVAKGIFILLSAILAVRFSYGGAAAIMLLWAFFGAFSGKLSIAVICFTLFPLLSVMNPALLPLTGFNGYILRLGPMFITIALVISSSSRQGRHALPLGWLFVYLFVAIFSSANGYCPYVSYLKIVNCAISFLGIWLGLRNIDRRPNDVMAIRSFMLVLSLFVVFGSLATLAAPGIAYRTNVSSLIQVGAIEAEDAELYIAQMEGIRLFSGVLNHSQALAILLPICLGWIACDMLIVEKRLSLVHVAAIATCLPLIYMTRSRSAMLSTLVVLLMIYHVCIGKIKMHTKLRNSMRSAMNLLFAVVIIYATFSQVRNDSVSKLLRKTDDVSGDARGLGEAFTASRIGAIESNMADFKRNPMLGSGFQVMPYMEHFQLNGRFILSAPIEKSILPLMVLGETGVIGFMVFLCFLVSFYAVCNKRKYYSSMTLMSVFLVSNMSEATFFSPGGTGGVIWVVGMVGGFTLDTIAICRNRLEMALARGEYMYV